MNERIRELAEQAGIEFDDDFSLEPETIYYLKLSDFERFAELVRADECEACAKFIEESYVRQFDEPWRENLSKSIRARRNK